MSDKIIIKLKNIRNLNNVEYADRLSDSEKEIDETINDIGLPEPESKDMFCSFAKDDNKEIEELLSRPSLIYQEEIKIDDNKNEQKSNEVQKVKEMLPEEKKEENINIKLEENASQSNGKEKEIEANNENKKKNSANFEEIKNAEIVEIQQYIPSNISKSLEEILNYLKETCPLKYV